MEFRSDVWLTGNRAFHPATPIAPIASVTTVTSVSPVTSVIVVVAVGVTPVCGRRVVLGDGVASGFVFGGRGWGGFGVTFSDVFFDFFGQLTTVGVLRRSHRHA